MASETHGSILLSTADSVSRMLMKKLDSETGFKPSEWTDNINLLGALPIRTASGTIAHFSDGAEDVPMKSVVANIVPIQDLHGYSKPWAAGAGSNIWDEQWELGDIDSTTGELIPSNYSIRSKNFIPCKPETAYYKYIGNGKANCIYYYDINQNFLSRDTNGNSTSRAITTPTGCYYMKFATYSTYGTTYLDDMAINYPSSVTTYSPYANVCPISGTSVLNVEQRGNNYFDQVYPNIDSNVNYKAISVPNGTYTMETTCPAPNGLANLFFLTGNVQSGTSTGTNGVWKGQTRTITVSDGYFTVAYRNANGANPQNYFTIVFDKSTAYTIDLGQEIMGGSADVVGGTGEKTSGTVKLKELSLTKHNSGCFYATVTDKKFTNVNMLCECFDPILGSNVNSATIMQKPDNSIGQNNGNNTIYIRADSYADVTALKSAVGEYKLAYELATPTEYTFTGQPINSYLGVNNLYTDSGEVLDVEYRADIDLLIAELGG